MSGCVAADESVRRFSGFVCFDLVSSVQDNIILKTWQAGCKGCSRLLIFLLLLTSWATNKFTIYHEHAQPMAGAPQIEMCWRSIRPCALCFDMISE